MEVFAEGFAPREVQFAIVEQNPTMLNITLYQVRITTTDDVIMTLTLSGYSKKGWKSQS